MTSGSSCSARVENGPLQEAAKDYFVVLVCGPEDGNDFMVDERASVSDPQTITREKASGIVAAVSPPNLANYLRSPSWWFQVALVRKRVKQTQYDTLQDIENVGGRLVGERKQQVTILGP